MDNECRIARYISHVDIRKLRVREFSFREVSISGIFTERLTSVRSNVPSVTARPGRSRHSLHRSRSGAVVKRPFHSHVVAHRSRLTRKFPCCRPAISWMFLVARPRAIFPFSAAILWLPRRPSYCCHRVLSRRHLATPRRPSCYAPPCSLSRRHLTTIVFPNR